MVLPDYLAREPVGREREARLSLLRLSLQLLPVLGGEAELEAELREVRVPRLLLLASLSRDLGVETHNGSDTLLERR